MKQNNFNSTDVLNTFFQMKELVVIPTPFSQVRNLEYPGFMNDTVSIIAKHGAAKYFVDGQYNILLGIQLELNELEVYYRKLPKTDDLGIYRDKRNDMISTILRQTKTLRRAGLASQTDLLVFVTPFVEKYLATIQDGNTKLKREHIRQLGKSFDDNTPLQAALESLGLKVFFDELRSVQNSIDLTLSEQVELMALAPKLDVKLIIKKSVKAMRNMFSAINLAVLEHPALDYSPLVNELNTYLGLYVSNLRLRATVRKNAAKKKAAKTKTATDTTLTSDTVAE